MAQLIKGLIYKQDHKDLRLIPQNSCKKSDIAEQAYNASSGEEEKGVPCGVLTGQPHRISSFRFTETVLKKK